MKQWKYIQYLGAVCFAFLLIWLVYFGSRDQFTINLLVYTILFGLLFGFVYYSNLNARDIVGWLAFSMLLRMVLLAAVPQLSDDYFRFIWDGKLILAGINPYQYTPANILSELKAADLPNIQFIFDNLNSPDYFSVYPPTNQLIFALSSWVGGENIMISVIVMRLILIFFELGVLLLLWKIAKLSEINPKQILLYSLNPLVILEITGNLHFEGIMLFFLLLGFYCFLSNPKRVGAWFGVAASLKLTVLILGPLLLNYLRRRYVLNFLAGALAIILLLFLPIIGNVENFLESIRLYYGKFEFNAGLYYFVRHISMFWIPYNPIAYLSPILTGIASVLIIWVAWKKPLDGILSNATLTYLVYLLLHTVVHPWYLIVPIGIAVLTPYRLFTVWSYLIFLSYVSYSVPEIGESAILLFLQYGGLIFAAFWDFQRFRYLRLSPRKGGNQTHKI